MSKYLNRELNYLIRFIIGGFLNTVFGYILFLFFFRLMGFSDFISVMNVYLLAPFFNYIVQRIYVYQTKLKKKFIYFYGAYIISFIFNITIHKLSLNFVNAYLSQLIGILSATIFTYIFTKKLFNI